MSNAEYLKDLISKAGIKISQQKMTILVDLTKTTKKAFSELYQFLLHVANHYPQSLKLVALSTQFKTGLAQNLYYFSTNFYGDINRFVWNTTKSDYSARSILSDCNTTTLDQMNITNPIKLILECYNETIQALNGSTSSAQIDPAIKCINNEVCSFDPVKTLGIVLGILSGLLCVLALLCKYLCGKKKEEGYIIIKERSSCLMM